MNNVGKAVAIVIRSEGTYRELLVFEHPFAGIQVPKGTIEPSESIEEATLRELEEESGLKLTAQPLYIGQWERFVEATATEPAELHFWHLSLLDAPADAPERWSHEAVGNVEEEGLIFAYRWLPLNASLPGELHPAFRPMAEMLLQHFKIDMIS